MDANNKKYVLITGGSTGIGYELAKIFAEHNFNLILVARTKKDLEQCTEAIAGGKRCHGHDISERSVHYK